MTLQFAISPDVNIQNVTDWFIFNTKLQRITGEAFHPTAYTDFADLHSAFEENRADLVYANAADTAYLVRDKGYLPIAWASGMAKEATVVVSADSEIQKVTDLTSPLTAAATDAPDVERICRILLEPADLAYPDIEVSLRPNPVLVAKAVMQGQVPVGFFPQNAYDELSSMVKMQLRELIRSRIYVVRSSLLASPGIAHLVEPIWKGLEQLSADPATKDLLTALGAPQGWERLEREDTEFMIDLMDALAQAGSPSR